MHTIALNYKSKSVKEKLLLFIRNFLDEEIEVTEIEDLKDLMAIEEVKKKNEENVPLENVLKEFNIEN